MIEDVFLEDILVEVGVCLGRSGARQVEIVAKLGEKENVVCSFCGR